MEVVTAWTDLTAALTWAKLPAELLLSLVKELGEDALPTMDVLAAVEADEIKAALTTLAVTAMKKARVNLLLNGLRLKYGLPPIDYTAKALDAAASLPSSSVGPPVDATAIASIVSAVAAAAKPVMTMGTVKMAHVIDQTSSDEVAPLDEITIDTLRQNLHTRLEGEPLEGEDFTNAQLTAFKRRLDAGQSPACDYAVLGPYGMRNERRMRFQATVKGTDGTERTIEVSGPDSLDTWESCHAVFKNLALACGVAKSSTLDNYKQRFRERCLEFPDQWALAVAADHVCRAEQWGRIRSLQKRMHDDAATRALSTYDPAMPWDSAIAASSVDSDFWARYFDRKALKAIAQGKRNAPIHDQILELPAVKRPKMHDQAGDGEPRRPDGRFVTDGGREFCTAYHHGGACQEGSCSGGKSHRCEFCRGYHRTTACGQKPAGWQPPQRTHRFRNNGGNKGKGDGGKGKKGDKGKGKKNNKGKGDWNSWNQRAW